MVLDINCSANTIFHNNFFDNIKNVDCDYNGNLWDDGNEGNYWDDYDGRDFDRDGIGDTPYIISENNQDNYPWMNINGKSKTKSINTPFLSFLEHHPHLFPILRQLLEL